jgi:hypothetical protein
MKKVIFPLYPNFFSIWAIWRGGQYGVIEAGKDKDKGGKCFFPIFVFLSQLAVRK